MVILTLLDPQHKTPIRQWRFERESRIRVGRALENDVVLADPLVSRYHLELRQVDGAKAGKNPPSEMSWQLINRSSNGTFVNGFLVTTATLNPAGLMQLSQGGPSLQFQILEPLASAPEKPAAPQLPTIAPQAAVQGLSQGCTHAGNPPENLFCIHCGQPLRVEKTIRQYQVLRTLGRGGMGTTYLVRNPWGAPAPNGQFQSKLLVLKEMNADVAQIPKAQELFEREASTLKALNHPGIPRFYDFFIDVGKKYLVMELIHGQDLEKHVRQHGPVLPPQAIDWMIQTCEVLQYLHSQPVPIIHRDIKPSNLLVRAVNNRIVVLDFGAVKPVDNRVGTRIGAEGFSAPEQNQGRPVIQSDLYAIGACLVYLLTGESPQHFYRRSSQGYRLQLKDCPAISLRLGKIIERATEPRPIDRYRSAQELASVLSGYF